jgi:hypothetical protein
VTITIVRASLDSYLSGAGVERQRMHLQPHLPLLLATSLLAGCGSGAPETDSGDLLHVSCLERPDTGICRTPKPAFYYDYQSDSCKRFLWGGCGAREPFRTLEECVEACGAREAF